MYQLFLFLFLILASHPRDFASVEEYLTRISQTEQILDVDVWTSNVHFRSNCIKQSWPYTKT